MAEPADGRAWIVVFLAIVDFCCVLQAAERYDRGQVLVGTYWLVAGVVFSVAGYKWPAVRKHAAGINWAAWNKRITVVLYVAIGLGLTFAFLSARTCYRGLFERQQPLSAQADVPSHSGVKPPEPQVAYDKTPVTSGKKNLPVGPSPIKPPSSGQSKEQLPRVDWHDKQNWRNYLHTGMTKTNVRHLFGEPEQISVFGTDEFWEYGRGEIAFDVEGKREGSLYSWSEPR
jgi:hypothetical protein